MGVKISFEHENIEKYHLEDNTSHLTFKDGRMISVGSLNDITITIDLRYCKGCGICTEECPTGSLTLEQERGRLRDIIHSSFPKDITERNIFNPDHLLPWQELPYHGGLIVANGYDSYNLTGFWRVGEVVIADADKCVLCGLCYQHCPEAVINIKCAGEV